MDTLYAVPIEPLEDRTISGREARAVATQNSIHRWTPAVLCVLVSSGEDQAPAINPLSVRARTVSA